MNSSGKTMSSAPSPAASSMSRRALLKTFVLAEHHRGGLHHRHAAGVLQISHGSTSLQNDTMIIPDGHAGTQQVSAQDAAAVVQRGEFRLHVQAVRVANSTHSTGSQDRFRLCIIRSVLSARHERDGRKGSANPSRSMESRRLTPPRLDRNRNAHPSAGIGGAFW